MAEPALAAPPRLAYGRHQVDDDDLQAVIDVLRSDRLTQGDVVSAFEGALCEVTGARHAVAVANGTAALHVACQAAGLGPGHRIGVPALTFVASANCVRYVGATPVPLDVDPDDWNLDLDRVPADLDGLVPVPFAGRPIDLTQLEQRPPIVIVDGAHALGAATSIERTGAGSVARCTTFSFHPVKPITSAEGGAIMTDDPDLAERLRRLRSHGVEATGRRPGDGWAVELGWNYRLSDVHAALGLSQLGRLAEFRARRAELAARYRERLAGLPLDLPAADAPGTTHAHHLFCVLVDERDDVLRRLRDRGIDAQVHYRPWHLQPWCPEPGIGPGSAPVAERIAERILSLPLHVTLSERDQDRVIAALEEIL